MMKNQNQDQDQDLGEATTKSSTIWGKTSITLSQILVDLYFDFDFSSLFPRQTSFKMVRIF